MSSMMSSLRSCRGGARARAQGETLGRPRVDEATQSAILRSLNKGIGIKKTAKMLGCGIATVYRVKNEAEIAAE